MNEETELYTDPASLVPADTGFDREAIESEFVKIVNDDFESAKRYMSGFHQEMLDIHRQYRSADKYEDLKKDDLFPVPLLQELTDQFVAEAADKLLYTGRPCAIVPLDDTQQPDADAKQEMMDFQDSQDSIPEKLMIFLRDAALYRIAVAAVNYCEKTITVLQEVPDGPPIEKLIGVDEMGLPVYETIQPMKVVPVDKPIFEGAETVRIAPWDFFTTRDKKSLDDHAPAMIRSYHDWYYYFGKDYMINADKVKALETDSKSRGSGDIDDDGKRHSSLYAKDGDTDEASTQQYRDIEWHGFVSKQKLFQYLGMESQTPIQPWERTRAILRVVEGKVLVRCQSNPYQYGRPSIVVGTLEREGESLIGSSPASKVRACCKGLDVATGMYLSNMKQVVNAGWIINENGLVNRNGTKTNQPGGIIWTNGTQNLDNIIKRIEAGNVAPDLTILQAMMRQWAKDAFGLQDTALGKGDPAAETLGENNILASSGSLRMRNYIKTFETTFVEPLYTLRNHIDALSIKEEYVFSVIGEGGMKWQRIDPTTIRAGVRFVCQASQRETAKAIITQQMLQLMQIFPTIQQQGFPTRLDILAKELCQDGFSLTERKIFELLPHLKPESEGLIDINTALIQRMMLMFAVQNAQAALGVAGDAAQVEGQQTQNEQAAQEIPDGASGEGVAAANQARNQTQVGDMNP